MSLTPLDIENTKFRGAFNGYNRAEVDQLLSRASQELEALLKQIDELKRRIGQLEQTVADYRESEELLKNSVVLAQRTSDEIIAAAHQQADAIKRTAETDGRETRQRLGELRAEREQFEYAFHGLLAGFLKRLEQGNPALARPAQSAPELQAPNVQQDEPKADPLSHSQQLLSEAATAQQAPQTPDAVPRIPQVETPPVPQVPAAAEPHGPGETNPGSRDDFEQVVEAARPVKRDAWPAPLEPAEEEELAAGDDTGEALGDADDSRLPLD